MPERLTFHELSMPNAYSDELTISQKKTATRSAVLGNFLRDQDAARVSAVVELKRRQFKNFRFASSSTCFLCRSQWT